MLHFLLAPAVDIQQKLLNPSLRSEVVGNDFLQELADMMGSEWPRFAQDLEFSSQEVQQIQSQDRPALAMLHQLRQKHQLTFGKLQELLKSNIILKSTL